jgi:hypothetical protein
VHPRPYLRRFALPGIGGGKFLIDGDAGIYRMTPRHPDTGWPTELVLENAVLFNTFANLSIF